MGYNFSFSHLKTINLASFGGKLSSCHFIGSANSSIDSVLVVGADQNRKIALFDISGRIYHSIEYTADCGFNWIKYYKNTQSLVIANSKRQTLSFCRIQNLPPLSDQSLNTLKYLSKKESPKLGNLGFDYMIEFPVKHPIIGLSIVSNQKVEGMDAETSKGKNTTGPLELYCVQSKAIQKYTISPDVVNPTSIESLPLLLSQEPPKQKTFEDTNKKVEIEKKKMILKASDDQALSSTLIPNQKPLQDEVSSSTKEVALPHLKEVQKDKESKRRGESPKRKKEKMSSNEASASSSTSNNLKINGRSDSKNSQSKQNVLNKEQETETKTVKGILQREKSVEVAEEPKGQPVPVPISADVTTQENISIASDKTSVKFPVSKSQNSIKRSERSPSNSSQGKRIGKVESTVTSSLSVTDTPLEIPIRSETPKKKNNHSEKGKELENTTDHVKVDEITTTPSSVNAKKKEEYIEAPTSSLVSESVQFKDGESSGIMEEFRKMEERLYRRFGRVMLKEIEKQSKFLNGYDIKLRLNMWVVCLLLSIHE